MFPTKALLRCWLTIITLALAAGSPADGKEPQWIWGSKEVRDGQRFHFRRYVVIASPVQRAIWTLTCDNHFVAHVGDVEVARGDDWTQPRQVDVTHLLTKGRHFLRVEGWNDGGPAGLIGRLEITYASGAEHAIVTAREWQVSATGDKPWERVQLLGAASDPGLPWPNLFLPREATPVSRITAAEGFEVELLASAQIGQGSWVCLAFDHRGRILISPQSGRMFRVTMEGENRDQLTFGHIGNSIRRAQGILHTDYGLFVNVNASAERGGGLYRLRDTSGDDYYDETERLMTINASGEHGGHAVIQGPDGLIYVLQGNHSELPTPISPTSAVQHYAEDLVLPREWDPRGHAVGVLAPGAHVLRFHPRKDPRQTGFELYAAGMRNPYDLAFHPDGELFTFDADMEWDIGLPWYRPIRVVHLVSGSESGWRSGSGKWPPYYFDSLPATVDIGQGSPTGIVFGTRSHFPEPFRSALFILDWTFGRILAVQLQESGASYTGTFETFLQGKPLNVTDAEFGPDGALYFITGGRGTQSGLYRVRHQDREKKTTPRPASARIPSPEAKAARETRRKLESYHGREDDAAIETAWPYLSNDDRFLRHAARVAIERQPVDGWRKRALEEKNPDARLASFLALVRVGATVDPAELFARVATVPYAGVDERRQLDELRLWQVLIARRGPLPPEVSRRLRSRLDPHFPAPEDAPRRASLDREMLQLLIALETPDIVDRALARLQATEDPDLQLHIAFCLRTVKEGWTPASRETYFQWLRAARDWSGGMSYGGFITTISRQALEHLDAEERAPYARLMAREKFVRPEPATDQGYTDWKLEDLLPRVAAASRGRDYDRGKAAFEKGLCHRCHRFNREGGGFGPDLTGVSGRFSRRDLLLATLLPSRDISDQYGFTRVVRRDGTEIEGRVLSEDATRLILNTDAFGDERVTVPKGSLRSRGPSPISPMPEDLLNGHTLEEILDLIAFLESGGDRSASAFEAD